MAYRGGPKRRYTEAQEAEQKAIAERMRGNGAAWSEVLAALVACGYTMSLATLQKRAAEWGIVSPAWKGCGR